MLLQEYQVITDSNDAHMLVDVRPSIEYEICSLPNSVSILNNHISARNDS